MEAVEFRGRVMASDLHLIVVPPTPARSEALIADVVSYIEHLERCWSRFLPTSDISRINRCGDSGGGELTVDPSTVALLAAMVEGFERTAGRFDPTLLAEIVAEGYGGSTADPARDTPTPTLTRSAVSLHDLVVDATTDVVRVPAGLGLDPGGIGKGLAADLAVARLLASGAVGALVEIGGDLAMGGSPVEDAGWTIEVERPDPADGVLCTISVSGGGVATSSTRSRRWMHFGVERHHQIDPDTGHSSETDLATVTVIAPTGWLAEVHATAALSAGTSGAIAHLEGHGLSGIAVGRDQSSGVVLMTSDLAALGCDQRSRSSAP